ALNATTIRGNHDRVASGLDEAIQFNPHARKAAYWTRAALPQSYRDYLANLPVGPLAVNADAQLVHGAVSHEDDYIFTEADALENFMLTDKPLTFFGHSHFSGLFSTDASRSSVQAASYENTSFATVQCREGQRLLVNPGSVGQPRDGNPRASFAIWDAGQA